MMMSKPIAETDWTPCGFEAYWRCRHSMLISLIFFYTHIYIYSKSKLYDILDKDELYLQYQLCEQMFLFYLSNFPYSREEYNSVWDVWIVKSPWNLKPMEVSGHSMVISLRSSIEPVWPDWGRIVQTHRSLLSSQGDPEQSASRTLGHPSFVHRGRKTQIHFRHTHPRLRGRATFLLTAATLEWITKPIGVAQKGACRLLLSKWRHLLAFVCVCKEFIFLIRPNCRCLFGAETFFCDCATPTSPSPPQPQPQHHCPSDQTSHHFPPHYVLPSAASSAPTYYNQCLIVHTKVQLNRCITPNVSLPHWFERNGVFERKGLQSSRCLAYLNGRPPSTPHITPTRLPIPETACGLEQEALCLLLFLLSQSAGGWKSAGRDIKGCGATPLLPTGQRWEEN